MTLCEQNSQSDDYCYGGGFLNGKRHGPGKLSFKEQLIFNGRWTDDLLMPGNIAWARFLEPGKEVVSAARQTAANLLSPLNLFGGGGNDPSGHDVKGHGTLGFYYGQLSSDGQRNGEGVLFQEKAIIDPEFKKCFESDELIQWKTACDDRRDPSLLKYMVYKGPWRDNRPHGEATQYFEGRGIYKGQFIHGKRHGRGAWRTLGTGKGWEFRPLPNCEIGNWENDKMHGIGVVEDDQHVHENVIYTDGICQMPFTDMGPPLTGFDDTRVIGTLVRAGRKGRVALGGNTTKDTNIEETTKDGERNMLMSAVGNQNQVNYHGLKAIDVVDDVEMALVREPTDLTHPDEDCWISGGTGDNEIMNGLYFKLSNTFGENIYRLIRRKHKRMGGMDIQERFLYQVRDRWIIGPVPGQGPDPPEHEGVAFIDDKAERPGSIQTKKFKNVHKEGKRVEHKETGWSVFHPQFKIFEEWNPETNRERDDEQERLKKQARWGEPRKVHKIDKISAKSIIGFEVLGNQRDDFVQPGLMLRHNRELYGRPVYEAESGSQFLYWLRDNGNLEEGLEALDNFALGESATAAKELFKEPGAWILAAEVGVGKFEAEARAYIDDMSVTPDQIDPTKHKWKTKKGDKGFMESITLRLQMEELNRDSGLLASFDEDDTGDGPELEPLIRR